MYISILTDSYHRLNNENKKSNGTAEDVEHEGQGKVYPVNLFPGRMDKRVLLSGKLLRCKTSLCVSIA